MAPRRCAEPGCTTWVQRGRCSAHSRRPDYGAEHRATRQAWAPRVATGTVACARCDELIAPDEPWDLDHDDGDRTTYLGPSHAHCNRAAPEQ